MNERSSGAVPASSPDELVRLAGLVDAWVAAQRDENPAVLAAERDPGAEPRWMVRLRGEDKSTLTVWFCLRQRTLHVETHFMPAPIERQADVYEYLLRANRRMHGMAFTIGPEDAVYLEGHVPDAHLDADELDRLLGSAYAYTEANFRVAMRTGFGARFGG